MIQVIWRIAGDADDRCTVERVIMHSVGRPLRPMHYENYATPGRWEKLHNIHVHHFQLKKVSRVVCFAVRICSRRICPRSFLSCVSNSAHRSLYRCDGRRDANLEGLYFHGELCQVEIPMGRPGRHPQAWMAAYGVLADHVVSVSSLCEALQGEVSG